MTSDHAAADARHDLATIPGRALRALVCSCGWRSDPCFTWEEAGIEMDRHLEKERPDARD